MPRRSWAQPRERRFVVEWMRRMKDLGRPAGGRASDVCRDKSE